MSTSVKKLPILVKASLVTISLAMTSLEDLSILVKASLGSSTLPSTTSYRTATTSRTQEWKV